MGVLAFGTGRVYSRIRCMLVQVDVLAFLDNDADKQGKLIDGCPVLPVKQVKELRFDAVILCSVAWEKMHRQLHELGVPDEKIIPYYMLRSLISGKLSDIKSEVFGSFASRTVPEKRAALFFNELGRSGAPLALLTTAEILRRHGWRITAYAECDGPLHKDLENIGIDIIIVENLSLIHMDDVPYIEMHNLVFVNTSIFAPLLRKYDINSPIVWWLHESEKNIYGKLLKLCLKDIKPSRCYVYTAGTRAKHMLAEFLPNWMNAFCGNLYYGRNDFFSGRTYKAEDGTIIFACIGYFCAGKAQEILAKAIDLLPDYTRKRAKFIFIGRHDKRVVNCIMQYAELYQEIKVCGEFTQDQIREVYGKIDVLVCPSRSDTMPIVVTEAMMCQIPCIISDNVGHTEFIKQGQNGWIFPTDDARRLAELISNIIDKPECLTQVGIKARKVYEAHFSMEKFEKKLEHVLSVAMRN